MDSIPKFLTTFIVIIIGVLLCISFIISSVVVDSARTYHSSVIDQIQASNFDEAVIAECIKKAKSDRYGLTIDEVTSATSGELSFYKVTLKYSLAAPLFGKAHKGEIVGYALPGARVNKIDGNGSDEGAEAPVPGLYESGSNYTVLLKSWDELVADGILIETETATGVSVGTGDCLGENPKSPDLAGDLMFPFDGSVTEIDEHGFFMCEELTGIKLSSDLKTIHAYAFDGCYALEIVELDPGLELVEKDAFNYCTVRVVAFNGTLKEWLKIEFATNKSNPTYGGAGVVISGEAVVHLTVPTDGVSSLYSKFNSSYGLLSVTIPDAVPGVTQLTEVPKTAFTKCRYLEYVSIGNGITRIGLSAFNDCPSLKTVIIPATVTEIDRSAFSSCKALTDIYFEGTVDQWNSITFGDYWNYRVENLTVHCTDGDVTPTPAT